MKKNKILVVYYSKTGNTKKIGEELAKKLNADVEEVIDLKNRREPEYTSCGMPLALGGYKPNYGFEFKEGIHYFYIDKPEDIEKLKDIDPRPYSEASKQNSNENLVKLPESYKFI